MNKKEVKSKGKNRHSVGSSVDWMNADKETVNKFLAENIDNMDEYKRKKQMEY